MKSTIFFSWQSDSPKKTNLDFIYSALTDALSRIESSQIEVLPVVDRDTAGVPGSPAIVETILEKIDKCGLFIADVTIISDRNAVKATPNPNVLIELGYAAARRGWERVICVMNQENGGPTKLPFDVRHRRWPIQYRLSSNATEEQTSLEKLRLSESLEFAIRTAIENKLLFPTLSLKDKRLADRFLAMLDSIHKDFAKFVEKYSLSDDIPVARGTIIRDQNVSWLEPILLRLAAMEVYSSKYTSNSREKPTVHEWVADLRRIARNMEAFCKATLNRYFGGDDIMIDYVEALTFISGSLESQLEVIRSPFSDITPQYLPADCIQSIRDMYFYMFRAYGYISILIEV
jgi:hypothetical protein